MEKKVYFYKMELCLGDVEQDYSNIKTILINLIDKHATVSNGYKTIDATMEKSDPLHLIFDIYEYNKTRLFARMSKQKPSNSMIQRDYKTYQSGEVLPGHNESEKGIEAYTYCLLDYVTGILAVVSNQSAPNEKALSSLFLKYTNHTISAVDLPNEKGIEEIYMGKEPEIGKIEVEVPLPNMADLKNIFGWPDDELIELLGESRLKVGISIGSMDRGRMLTTGSEESKKLIDCIKSALPGYAKARMKARTKSMKAREYDFFSNNFSYPIEIPMYHIVQDVRVYYTADDLREIYKANLIESFNTNRILLTTIADRVM